jgi:hypothetical protein
LLQQRADRVAAAVANVQTTNNLLECGELALSSSVDGIPNLQPYK